MRMVRTAAALCVATGSAVAGVENSLFVLDFASGDVWVYENDASGTTLVPNRVIETGIAGANNVRSDIAVSNTELFFGDRSTVTVFDVETGAYSRTFTFGHQTDGLTVGRTDAYGLTLFAWARGKLYMHDPSSGAELGQFDFSSVLGGSFSVAAAYDWDTGLIAVSDLSASGLIAWIDPDAGTISPTVSANNKDYEGGFAYFGGELLGAAGADVVRVAADGTTTNIFSPGFLVGGLATVPSPAGAFVLVMAGLQGERRRR